MKSNCWRLAGTIPAVLMGSGLAQAAEPPVRGDSASQLIADRYIVVFNDRVARPDIEAANLVRGAGGELHFTYANAVRGFAATLPEAAVKALANNPNVAYVEQDQTIELNATQSNATWGLNRIDQRNLPLDGSYVYNYTGSGVTAFIIDTGIRSTHADFGGRVAPGSGYTAIGDGRGTDDCNGHGTHVAGTVGGGAYGVAKGVSLVPVRVLDCRGSGTTSGVIAGVDFVAGSNLRPAVGNMSLGGGASSTLDSAVAKAVAKGVTMVVAAGNDGGDACSKSPAREPSAVTVGATTSSDARASYSNYGTCLDLFAPGSSITSAWYTSDTSTSTISGTSMAAPHVAGVAALALQYDASRSPAAVVGLVTGQATIGKVTSPGTGSPNLLLYSLVDGTGGGGTTPNNPPAASFTDACTGLTCSFTDTSTDGDGSVVSRSWAFGDGATSTAQNPSRTYAVGGTYMVSLTVTDDDGATATASRSVTVSAPAGAIMLGVGAYKLKGLKYADLTWGGAASQSVDVFRDGVVRATTANDGTYTDGPLGKGGGSARYKVCAAGTSTCSNEVTVSW